MKQLILLLLSVGFLWSVNAQENPYEKYGYKPKIVTMSGGKYQEFHDRDTIVRIGNLVYNTKSKKLIGFELEDTLVTEATLAVDVVSRWISPDPLAHKFPSWSPYNYANGNPIYFIDPDGRAVVPANKRTRVAFTNALYNQFNSKVGNALASSFNAVTNSGDINQAMSQKAFNKILRKSDLDDSQKSQATSLFNAITSEKENFLDIRTFEEGQTQVAIEEGGYYNVDGESASIRGMQARTPEKLKNHKLETRTISELNQNGTSTSFSTANEPMTGEQKRISLTISLPANPGTVTNQEEQGFIQGVITGNENTGN